MQSNKNFGMLQECVRLSRRTFVKVSALGAAALAFFATRAEAARKWLNPRRIQQSAATPLDSGVKVAYTACLGCNARCGMRTVVKDGRLVKVSGNPYHPYNENFQPVPYDTPVKETLAVSSSVCGKAEDAPNYLYNPYRLIRPLKRSGERGSGRFEPIDWTQMISEIAKGGKLFTELGDQRDYPGLASLLRDDLIDSTAPELGTVRNGFVFIAGRDQAGYTDFTNRFVRDAVGSINRIAHTDICGLGFRMGNFALSEQTEVEIKADPLNAEYILVFGANIYEALQPGINTYGALVAKRRAEGKLRFTIIDPRATNASAHADRWVPVKPGQDGPFAMGLIRWIIDNDHHNIDFLSAANPQAAKNAGFGCYTNATHLAIADSDHEQNGRFLRWVDLQIDSEEELGNAYVVLHKNSVLVPFDQTDQGMLDAETIVKTSDGNSIRVKTAFRLMKESLREKSLDEYARLSGVPVKTIVETARDFTSFGTRAAVCQYHGAGNYPGGTYAAFAVAILNALVGSIDMQGGYLKGGGAAAPWNEGIFDLKTFPGQRKPDGVPMSRERAVYENSSEFKRKQEAGGTGYPAKRPWFPFTRGGLCVETLSGIDQQYPYGCKILFTYFFNPIYSIPGGNRFTSTLKDQQKVPLHVSIDIGINESNLYADYIIPGLTYLEGQYAFLTPHAPALKFTAIRTPVVEPLTNKTNDGRPFCLETFLIDLAEHLDLPGFGSHAIPWGDGNMAPLHQAEDYFVRGLANLAHGSDLPEANAEEINFVETNYPVAEYHNLLETSQWRQVCYLLARGGVFNRRYEEDFEDGRHLFGLKRVVLYNETLAQTRNSLTGERYSGTIKYEPPTDCRGGIIDELDKDYPFTVVTYKMNLHAQSRTTWHRWSMEVFPENFVMLHEEDARRLKIQNYDKIRLISRSLPDGVIAKARISRLIRPGNVGISFHYGHTQLGASNLPIKNAHTAFLGGENIAGPQGLVGDPRLGTGILPNLLGRLDPHLDNTPLVDVLAGIPDFSSTRVRIERI
jgi:tetrathionate reductase subunit A